MLGGSNDETLQNLTICNITFQNISLESREQIEKLLYRISADREVLDAYHTWELPKRGSAMIEGARAGQNFESAIGPKTSMDLAKQAGYSGSVQYFHDFMFDTSAWPSPDRTRMDAHLWAVPYYEAAVETILPVNWREKEGAQKRMGGGGGGGCFNCGSTIHGLSACPKPKDQDRIRKAITEWRRSRMDDGGEMRYHQTPGAQEMTPSLSLSTSGFRSTPSAATPQKPKAGVISERLRQALDIDPGQIPPWYRNVVYYGYPPSYYRVPPAPVKFTWVEPGSDSTATPETPNSIQHPQPQRRIRTVTFPNLAAPLHDLSVFFDLYHPVEAAHTPTLPSNNPIATPTAKYQVTTLLDGIHPVPSRTTPITPQQHYDPHHMMVDLTAESPASKNPKKRNRSDSPYKGPLSPDQNGENSEDMTQLPQGPPEKIPKLQELQTSSDLLHAQEPSSDAADWAQNLLDRLSEAKILRQTEEEDREEAEEPPTMPLENVAAYLPISTGIIRHQLSEQDLSTHGSVQSSTGIWKKLKSILDERRQ